MMQGKNDKMIVVPYEAASFISSLATVKKLFDDAQAKDKQS
jgi:hypothetical protein